MTIRRLVTGLVRGRKAHELRGYLVRNHDVVVKSIKAKLVSGKYLPQAEAVTSTDSDETNRSIH